MCPSLSITESLKTFGSERGNSHGSQKPHPIGYKLCLYRMGVVVHLMVLPNVTALIALGSLAASSAEEGEAAWKSQKERTKEAD